MVTEEQWLSGTTNYRGVWWHEAPLPRRWHRCFVQTNGWVGFRQVQRCACGAVRFPVAGDRIHQGWFNRNSRR